MFKLNKNKIEKFFKNEYILNVLNYVKYKIQEKLLHFMNFLLILLKIGLKFNILVKL
jgi:hypothetical protein